jgi:hypothetical protein
MDVYILGLLFEGIRSSSGSEEQKHETESE